MTTRDIFFWKRTNKTNPEVLRIHHVCDDPFSAMKDDQHNKPPPIVEKFDDMEPRDDWWEEVDKNRRKEDEESSRDDLRQLLKFESVKGNEKAVIDSILDGIPKSEIRHMLVKKLSNEDHQKWEHQQIKKHFREGNQCL